MGGGKEFAAVLKWEFDFLHVSEGGIISQFSGVAITVGSL